MAANLEYLPDEILLNYIRTGRGDLNDWHREENDSRKRLAAAERMVALRRKDLTAYLEEAEKRGLDPNPGLGTILYVGTRECAIEKGFPEVILPSEIEKLRGAEPGISIVLCGHCFNEYSSGLIQEVIGVVDVINGGRRG